MAHSVKSPQAKVLQLCLLLLILAVSACGTPDYVVRPADDVETLSGDHIAVQMVDALGGMAAYQRVKRIEFSFVVNLFGKEVKRRFHVWDKEHHQAYIRFEHDDKSFEVWLRLDDKSGVVHADGKRLEPNDAAVFLKEAYAMWVNDTYWLVAPYKVLDDGTHRAFIEGKLRLSFAKNVGLTPGDVYFFELDDDNKPVMWSFYLESGTAADVSFGRPVAFDNVTFYLYREAAIGTFVFDDLHVHTRTQNDNRFVPLQKPLSK